MAYDKTILVVDDEPDVVSLLEATLKGDGFNVLTAYDGIAALDLCSTEKPDLVLLDIMMPMMSGYEVCEQIKANPMTQQIPVLCISSAHTPEARAQSIRVGAAELIKKPFLPKELIAQIRRHLPKENDF
ncbi:MAG TPA: response regulator [Candidatus Hydrogenedentes bacterium]|jgi:DNA-binding response OmpR family regulator|nr:MAG: Alkaline phosphatase synthesis transcriptional regulatory protein PhoP [Candidatus Hydrogenedentes bacterium ADurb.Bin170]HNZ47476.1 response regulator [Candidatus Hydrogenedentota bacterium]HOD95403.1 response regulator [Candidatus Hydrogenedentota bacterium]HOH43073.1 response regulator [Candidatus Hydrogenedentota bacterium]HOM48378.1 response regulator [Candidatus Hydrogenedentota bacterium]